jgi:hypothetical protein
VTIEEAMRRVEEIRAIAGDDETAHSLEDQLRADFIRWVAKNQQPSDTAQAIALVVESTRGIEFARWCA